MRSRSSIRVRSVALVAGAATLALGIGGAALAAAAAGNTINGCYDSKTGALRVLIKGKCAKDEIAISWNKQGPAGPPSGPVLPSVANIATLHWWASPISGSNDKFASPAGVAFDGTHVWVVNSGGNSLTELNPLDGSLVRVVSAAADKLRARARSPSTAAICG